METSVAPVIATLSHDRLNDAATQLKAAADARKCWSCGCLHQALEAFDRVVPKPERPTLLTKAMEDAKARLQPKKYECLGCEECYPAVAVNALGAAGGGTVDICPTETVETRAGWPPLPGSYRVLRFHAPVAVCTLNTKELIGPITAAAADAVAIAGTLQTENLGIERLITNVLANPSIRFLVVCGDDSRKAIGHLPGQSLIALAQNGVSNERRIIDAKGKRPILRNLQLAAIDHFRKTVDVIDLIGTSDVEQISTAVRGCAGRNPGAAEPFALTATITPVAGRLPDKMMSDPAGYFVIFIDRVRALLSLEHYKNNGVLTTIIEGHSAGEVYMTAIERALISRLDHAAYLGRELARAEIALSSDEAYVQDAAPEQCTSQCTCHSS